MKQYAIILDKALTAQGWSKRNGKDGKIVYHYENGPGPSIGIYGTIDEIGARDVISKIRRVQPSFTCELDSPQKRNFIPPKFQDKKPKNIEDPSLESVPIGCPTRFSKKYSDSFFSWIKKGCAVRFSAGSNYAYQKMHDENEVISKRFIVEKITLDGKIVISCDGSSLTVLADEIDMYETKVCNKCGQELPKNHFYEKSGCCKTCQSAYAKEKRIRTDKEDALLDYLIHLSSTTEDENVKKALDKGDIDISRAGSKTILSLRVDDDVNIESLSYFLSRYLEQQKGILGPVTIGYIQRKKKEEKVPECSKEQLTISGLSGREEKPQSDTGNIKTKNEMEERAETDNDIFTPRSLAILKAIARTKKKDLSECLEEILINSLDQKPSVMNLDGFEIEDLLKELKKRGVKMDNIRYQIVVEKTINMDDL